MPRADWSGVTLPFEIMHKDAGKLAWIRSRWQCRLLPLWPCQQTFLLSQRFQLTNLANFAGICMETLLCSWIYVQSVHYVILFTLGWALEMDFVVKVDWSYCNDFWTNKVWDCFIVYFLSSTAVVMLFYSNSIQFIYSLCCWLNYINGGFSPRWKFFHHLLTLLEFQTFLTFYLLCRT